MTTKVSFESARQELSNDTLVTIEGVFSSAARNSQKTVPKRGPLLGPDTL